MKREEKREEKKEERKKRKERRETPFFAQEGRPFLGEVLKIKIFFAQKGASLLGALGCAWVKKILLRKEIRK